jgi:transaldolase
MLDKLNLINKDPESFSLETVKMFYRDACAAGYQIEIRKEAAALSA